MKISKQKRPVLICVLVFAVLLIAYFAVVRPLVNSGLDSEDTEPLVTLEGEGSSGDGRFLIFPQVERSGMQSILVENEYGTYEFYRAEDDSFQIRGWEGVTFDATKFSSLVTFCGYTLSNRKVMDNATDADLAEYGLDKPRASWTLTTTTGTKYKVYLGYDLLTGGGYYCMLEGRPSVYVLNPVIDDSISNALLGDATGTNTSLYELPTYDGIVFTPIEYFCTPVVLGGISQDDYYNIEDFTIYRNSEPFVSFYIVDPEDQNNQEALIEHMMRYPANYFPDLDILYAVFYDFMTLTGLNVVHLGDPDADLSDYGLTNPAHSISFTYKGQEILLSFSELQEDGTYYVLSSQFPELISRIGFEKMYYLEYNLQQWVAKYPFQQWITAISAIEIQGYGTDVRFDMIHGTDPSGDATLEVKTSTGLTIPNSDIYNFRQFFKTLLATDIQGYAELSGEKLTKEQIKSITSNEENLLLTFTFTKLSGDKMVYRFYSYSPSGRPALMTVNGSGEFYVLADNVKKLASDAEKVLAGLDVDAFGKN